MRLSYIALLLLLLFSFSLYLMLGFIIPASSSSTNATKTRRIPPNVRFEIDDVEADWTYHQKFDYIHCRFMGNAIYDWPRLIRQCFE